MFVHLYFCNKVEHLRNKPSHYRRNKHDLSLVSLFLALSWPEICDTTDLLCLYIKFEDMKYEKQELYVE